MKRLILLAACVLSAAPEAQRNSLNIELVRIAPGTFEMGVDSVPLPKALTAGVRNASWDRTSDAGDYDETPVHKVTITQPFWISATEITVEQYRQFRPDFTGNPDVAPYVSGVSWDDAVAFCQWLSEKEGKPYRLPTEAEWEYVARAGTRTPFSSGMERPEPEAANAWGVKNMHTAVAEWVSDWHGPYPATPQTDPVGPSWGIARVVRGGGLDHRATREDGPRRYPAEMAYFARSANRAGIAPGFRSPLHRIGFRVVQAPPLSTRPLPYRPTLFQSAVKQDKPNLKVGPDPAKPYYHTRPMFPRLGAYDMRAVGWRIGFAPGLGTEYHNSAVQVLDNGDLVAAYYNTSRYEDDPEQTVMTLRLRYGAEDWDMPEPWPDFPDAADAAPVFWNDRGTLWLFFGSSRLLGGPPFWFLSSTDNGATWSHVSVPNLTGEVGKYTPQPINSVVRGRDGAIYLPVDGAGSTSVVFVSKDDGKTWTDPGGRTGGRHTTLVEGRDGALIGFGGKNSNVDGFMPKSTSRDGGRTWEKTKTPFRPLGSGQRPSVIRLASGKLFFVGDLFDKKKMGPKGAGAMVALSDDDGETWTPRQLPGIVTVGYTTATQAPNGVIHIVTSKSDPAVHIELNEAWIREGGPELPEPTGQFRLNGRQTFRYPDGKKQWEVTYERGHRTGVETWWSPEGRKEWEKQYRAGGVWTWRRYDTSGRLVAESEWKGKELTGVKFP